MDIFDIEKKPVGEDWDNADIIYALRKAGWSLRQLSLHHGYYEGAAKNCLQRPWPRVERIIAGAIGVQPQTIWLSRYNKNGTPSRKKGRPTNHTRCITPPRFDNVNIVSTA